MDLPGDLFVCLRFLSRLPWPAAQSDDSMSSEIRPLADAAAMVPVAGAIIGTIAAGALVIATAIGLPPLAAATVAIAALVCTSGALHEDGLADCADGFGGGHTRDRKLEIMRDSRIGTFGACALMLGLLFRAACLGAMTASGPWLAASELVAAAAISRFACVMPLALLAPARLDGLGTRAGRPRGTAIGGAFCLATIFALLPLVAGLGLGRALGALALAMIGALGVCGIAARQIGGQTGDVAGAAQQAAEAAALLVYAIAAGAHG